MLFALISMKFLGPQQVHLFWNGWQRGQDNGFDQFRAVRVGPIHARADGMIGDVFGRFRSGNDGSMEAVSLTYS
jgi:hypothetical protein